MNFFCHLPWTAVDITTINCAPCCVYHRNNLAPATSLSEYLASNELKEVKSQLLKGQAPNQCQTCVSTEKNNGHSFRLLHNKFHDEKTQEILNNPDYNKSPAELHIFTSNTCNLLCLPCNGEGSYVRGVELNKLGITKNIPIHIKKNHVLDDVHKFDFEKITFLGGEPFADKVTFECLTNLVTHQKSKDVTLYLNTNGTLIDKEKMDFLSENFKFVYIKASLDGYGVVNDYLRYPSTWDDLEARIMLTKNYPNTELLVTTALSNLSLIKYYQLVEWSIQNSVMDIFLSLVQYPNELEFGNLPADLKLELLEKYQALKSKYQSQLSGRALYAVDTCINICQNPNKKNFDATMSWLDRHDKIRGNNLLAVFPELKPYAKT